jgi:hypothetical protein
MPNSFAKKWNVGDCSLRRSIGSVDHRNKMTGDESRELEIGDRVCWGADKNDQGSTQCRSNPVSPAVVSAKREYLRIQAETFRRSAAGDGKMGAWRR